MFPRHPAATPARTGPSRRTRPRRGARAARPARRAPSARRPAAARWWSSHPAARDTSPASGRPGAGPERSGAGGSPQPLCLGGFFRGLLVRLLQELLGELALPGRIELLELVLDRAPVVRLVPVIERVEAEQDRFPDELAEHLVRRAHHPTGLRVTQVALELHVALVPGSAAGVEHLVDDVRDVLRR